MLNTIVKLNTSKIALQVFEHNLNKIDWTWLSANCSSL